LRCAAGHEPFRVLNDTGVSVIVGSKYGTASQ
jgi:hypothetical protein